MAAVVPLVAAVAGAAATSAIGTGLLASLGGFVVSSAVNQLGSRLFSKKPKTSAFGADASGRVVQIRSSVESHKIIYGQARVSGPLVLAKTTDAGYDSAEQYVTGANKFLHFVIPLAGHQVEEIGTVYINDVPITNEYNSLGYVTAEPYYKPLDGISYVRISKNLGSPDQQADPLLIRDCGLTAAHRLRGIAYIYVQLQYNADVFPLGAPNFSAVVKGKRVYDPRTGLTLWSDNSALCIRDYLSQDYGFGCASDEIDDAHFIAAANTCDEAVTLSTGGTQARYTCNGVIDTAVAPLENLNQLVSSLAGAVTYVQGKFRAHAGAYDTPAGEVPTSIMAGGLKLRARTPRKELFNAVKGTYVDPNKSWQPTDFPPVTNSTYQTQDNGEQIFKDLELPFTTHPERAQRIAKLILEKARQGLIVDVPVNHAGLKFAAFDVVTLTNDQMGWSDKPFRVLKWALQGGGPIALTLQEESSASYDWNSGEATTVDPAPDTNLPDPLTVSPPGTPFVVEDLYVTNDGSAVKSKAVVTWPASTDAFVRDYQVEYKLTEATDYTLAGRTFATTLEVLDMAPGTYDFRVKAYSNLGVSSAYANTVATIFGLTAPPADIVNFSLSPIHNNAHLSWNQVADLDVRVGGKIRIRYTPELVSPTWSSAIDIGPALPGVASQAVLPLLDGTYLAKAVDSSGNESASAAAVVSTVANIVKMNRVITLQQEPGFFAGDTHFGMVKTDGGITLDTREKFDSGVGDFDSGLGLFDGGGGSGFVSRGEYLFHLTDDPATARVDLGRVMTFRASFHIRATTYDPLQLFDSGVGDFDSGLGLFDGEDLTGIDLRFKVYLSAAGTCADQIVENVFSGDFTARYVWFSLEVNSNNTAINVLISELRAHIDVPDITDSGSLVTSASGVTAVSFAKDFYISPDVGVTIQSATVGDQEIVQNVTDTGFDIGVKDSGGSFVARTVSWAANGY